MAIETMFATIDRLFDENRPKEAEAYMREELKKAQEEGRLEDQLTLNNELIGYYRQTSEKEPLLEVVSQAIEVSKKLKLEGTIPFATTMINAGTAYRSIGELAKAKECYDQAEQIYVEKVQAGELSPNDMLLAGLCNNISLMYQEQSDFEKAEAYQLKALSIAESQNAGFEIAVTNANLANTYLQAEDYEKSKEYAKKAIALFKERNFFDPHYCAALSALGSCYLGEGALREAKAVFEEALKIVENTFGKNAQYARLKESLALCDAALLELGAVADVRKETQSVKGLALSKLYFETYGLPMIREKFPEYEGRIACGLVGEGSDCFGFDDVVSTDHDFGPDFCLWLTDETYDQIGKELTEAYNQLPKEFMGYTRTTTAMGASRRGVLRISDFYKKFLNTDQFEEINFRQVPDYALSACTNGAVFLDEEGVFSEFRRKLLFGYPEEIRFLKIAEAVAGFSQCGQYNYGRMRRRGDELTANLMLADFAKHTMKLTHYFYNEFPPHDKWLAKSMEKLDGGNAILECLNRILKKAQTASVEEIEAEIENLAAFFSANLYASGEISDTDSYLDHHIQELMLKSGISMLSVKELARKIARLEFEAFDKVQNEGGRASCQNDWPTFSVMRKSQYLTWSKEMLMQYFYDFTREYEMGHNLITEKYGRMMESTAKERYDEIKENFPEISAEKKAVIEQIVGIQMQMVEAFAKQHGSVASNARNLHTSQDNPFDTSYETYLRGEISTYSDKMLQLYGQFVVGCAKEGKNIAYMTIENTAKLYGYKNLEEFEKASS